MEIARQAHLKERRPPRRPTFPTTPQSATERWQHLSVIKFLFSGNSLPAITILKLFLTVWQSSLGHNSLQQAQNYPSQLYSSSTEDSPSSNSARSLSSSQALAGFGNQLVFRDRNLSPSYVNNGRFGFDDTVASEDNSRAGINDNLKETDFCPICSRRLPAPDPATGSEASREMHIQDCIRRAENPATDTMNAWHDDTAGSPLPGSNNQSHTPSATRRAARRCRMVIYEATTKDTHQDGEELECVICFEGFKVGEPVARLDCFCRYHKVNNNI